MIRKIYVYKLCFSAFVRFFPPVFDHMKNQKLMSNILFNPPNTTYILKQTERNFKRYIPLISFEIKHSYFGLINDSIVVFCRFFYVFRLGFYAKKPMPRIGYRPLNSIHAKDCLFHLRFLANQILQSQTNVVNRIDRLR